MTVPKRISARAYSPPLKDENRERPWAQGHQGGWVASSGGEELVDAAQLLIESGVV